MPNTNSVGRDIDLLALRLRAEMVTDRVLVDQVRAIMSEMSPDGTWPDIDYADRARTHWSPAQHTLRTALLARAHRQTGHPMAGQPALERAACPIRVDGARSAERQLVVQLHPHAPTSRAGPAAAGGKAHRWYSSDSMLRARTVQQ